MSATKVVLAVALQLPDCGINIVAIIIASSSKQVLLGCCA